MNTVVSIRKGMQNKELSFDEKIGIMKGMLMNPDMSLRELYDRCKELDIRLTVNLYNKEKSNESCTEGN